MPKFVSGSSGHIYAYDKTKDTQEQSDNSNILDDQQTDANNKKPSAINKKGIRDKQKNSLDLFKEELRRIQEEKDLKSKKSIKSSSSSSLSSSLNRSPTQQLPLKQHKSQLAPIPLKPDPRCPTSLTLQVNQNPKEKDIFSSGSYDNGDPNTTNLYVGNINPTVNETDLCDIFGRYGPLASIKIMWPRTDEERARNRNSGFVAYMSRIDAERALKSLNGLDLKGYDMKLDLKLSNNCDRVKGTLGKIKNEMLGDILRNLNPTREKIGFAMHFCINHADAAGEIIGCIYESLLLLETPFQKKIARMFLVSDILNNCSASVTNASYYRIGFQLKLESIFKHLREYLINIEDRYKADRFKQKILTILGAWKEWTLYENEFIIRLSNILLGITSEEPESSCLSTTGPNEKELDGEPLADEMLQKCLEAKGLSLHWYKTLDLSDLEEEDNEESSSSVKEATCQGIISVKTNDESGTRFKTSKWETVDPDEVAEQVITLSKWDLINNEEEEGLTDSCGSSDFEEKSVKNDE